MTDTAAPARARRAVIERTIVVAPAGSVAVATADVVTLELSLPVFGLTRKACEGKIYRGDWLEGRQYHRDPQGMIWLDVKGVKKWVMGGEKA